MKKKIPGAKRADARGKPRKGNLKVIGPKKEKPHYS